MVGKYRVRLSLEERETLTRLTTTGKGAAAKLLHARILLKADEADGGDAWTDEAIAEAFDVSLKTIARVRQALVEQGLEDALQRKAPTGRQYRKLDGKQEAHLVALACSSPPEGSCRWTLKLLADKLVALEIVDSISPATVHRTLKKTT
jgi:transposase